MKIQAGSIFGSIGVLIFCLFMGVTVGSIGLGAAFPPANLVAKPFVCLLGKMTYEQATSNPLPGTTRTSTTWFCVDPRTGAKTELGIFPMALYAGIIYGVLLYVVVLMVQLLRRLRQVVQAPVDQTRLGPQPAAMGNFSAGPQTTQPAPAGTDAMARMERLKELRAANMISEVEYQQKRDEILKEL